MYGDPANIRSHAIKIRLSDKEQALVDSYVDYTGQQKAAVLREVILAHIESSMEVTNEGAVSGVADRS